MHATVCILVMYNPMQNYYTEKPFCPGFSQSVFCCSAVSAVQSFTFDSLFLCSFVVFAWSFVDHFDNMMVPY